MDEATVAAKVAEWNDYYRSMGREIRLKDLTPDAYESEVAHGLFDCCEEDADLAIAVFKHKDNEGGWMCGDVVAYIEKNLRN